MTDVKRNKAWGYEVEVQALEALSPLFSGLERTGASSQKSKGWPDLVQEGHQDPFLLLVSKEKGAGKPLLITLTVDDFLALVALGLPQSCAVAVSVKGRAQMWAHRVFQELKDGTRAWRASKRQPFKPRKGTYPMGVM